MKVIKSHYTAQTSFINTHLTWNKTCSKVVQTVHLLSEHTLGVLCLSLHSSHAGYWILFKQIRFSHTLAPFAQFLTLVWCGPLSILCWDDSTIYWPPPTLASGTIHKFLHSCISNLESLIYCFCFCFVNTHGHLTYYIFIYQLMDSHVNRMLTVLNFVYNIWSPYYQDDGRSWYGVRTCEISVKGMSDGSQWYG